MKVRNGFVSNSSSSSFLVVSPFTLRTVTDVVLFLICTDHSYYSRRNIIATKRNLQEILKSKEAGTREVFELDSFLSNEDKKYTIMEVAEYLGVPSTKIHKISYYKTPHQISITKANRSILIQKVTEFLEGNILDQLLTLDEPKGPDWIGDSEAERQQYAKAMQEWQKKDKAWRKQRARQVVNGLLIRYENYSLCEFHASDKDSYLGSCVEHGDTFRNAALCITRSEH